MSLLLGTFNSSGGILQSSIFLRAAIRLGVGSALLLCTALHAQTPYDTIEVGTTLNEKGIGLGFFAKPIPLPKGEWSVVGKHEQQLALRGGRPDAPSSTPRVTLTLRNTNRQETPLVAIIVSFTPNSIPINWGNQPCTNSNPLGLVDDFNLKADSMLYVCARADAVYNFRETIRDAQNNTNEWVRTYISALTPYADDIPRSLVLVDIYGNKFRGKWMGMTFLLRADANADANKAYREHLSAWMHTAGENWMKVINNDASIMHGPEIFSTTKLPAP